MERRSYRMAGAGRFAAGPLSSGPAGTGSPVRAPPGPGVRHPGFAGANVRRLSPASPAPPVGGRKPD